MLDSQPTYHYLFLRPRRFGKSTFLQTLAKYYNIRLKSQFARNFGGLYIGKNPTESASSLLVLCFDLSTFAVSTLEKAEHSFHGLVYHTLHKFLMDNKAYLPEFDAGSLLDKASGANSLRAVLVRYLLTSSKYLLS